MFLAPLFLNMLEDTKKLRIAGTGHKKVVKTEKKQPKELDPKYFNPDAQRNWLFNDDPEYRRKRKRKKKE